MLAGQVGSGGVREIQDGSNIDRLFISRSSVRSRDGPPIKSMGYEIRLIAHFLYVGTV